MSKVSLDRAPAKSGAGGEAFSGSRRDEVLDPLEILDQILLCCLTEVQVELRIVVVHHVKQGEAVPLIIVPRRGE